MDPGHTAPSDQDSLCSLPIHDKNKSGVQMNICSRCYKQTTFFEQKYDRIRAKKKYNKIPGCHVNLASQVDDMLPDCQFS